VTRPPVPGGPCHGPWVTDMGVTVR
jgi:hypothetical protein